MNGQELFNSANCPICGNAFDNKFYGKFWTGHSKTCQKIDHYINSLSEMNKLIQISLLVNHSSNRLIVTWSYEDFLVGLESINSVKFNDYQYIDWFEPDFSDYRKLIKKLKTYITFS